MENIEVLTLVLIIATGLITYKGLKEFAFQQKYLFNIDEILIDKKYIRLISSGFLHSNWKHFAFNMISLYLFGSGLEGHLGIESYLLIYFVSLVGGNLFALYIHRNHGNYSALGASGAVSGVIFASIGVFPGMEIGLILLPIFFPAWIYAIAYILYTIYGITAKKDNIGHEAHLGGAITGLLLAIAINPAILKTNYLPIALTLVPALAFLILIIKKPHILIINHSFSQAKATMTIDDKYHDKRISEQEELDDLLDKVHNKGYEKLSQHEKNRLNELSK